MAKFYYAALMGRGKQKKPKVSVVHLKKMIGERVRELRGDISQEAIEAATGVDRGIISHIERGTKRNYGIDHLLAVLGALKESTADKVFAPDNVEELLHGQLSRIWASGVESETRYVMDALRHAEAEIKRVRASPLSKPQRPA